MFKKSLFSKILFVNFLIILISFIIVAGLLYGLMGDYVTSEKATMLKYTGTKINEMTTVLMENNNVVAQKLYQINLELYAANTQSLIIITDKDGQIISSSQYINNARLSKKQYQEVIEGKEIKRIGKFEGMFDETVLTVGVPIKYKEEIVGGIFLYTPIPKINKVRCDIFRLFISSMLVAILVEFILIYFLSRDISDPLKEINKAAKTIASGHFENKLDITSNDEIGELASSFNFMADALKNLEEMRKEFVANVSHELRTPMTTIGGFVQGIIDGTIPHKDEKKYLNIVLSETRRLSRLINDLLDVSKIESGEIKFDFRRFNINELIRECIIKFENRITNKNMHINAYFENEGCIAKADPDAIERVITNLIDNSIKFSKNNTSIDISVSTKSNKIYISIKDYGMGIKEEELKYIWDRFYKTDKSRSKDKIGTGLGLHIVKSIINGHGEEIWVESKIDEYTKFTFTLAKG